MSIPETVNNPSRQSPDQQAFLTLESPSPNFRNASLEAEFESHCIVSVDIHKDCGFSDYLEPNEGSPESIKPHLKLAKRGIIVSTGTERSFFDLLFSDAKKCEGLVIRDINPKVKAYVDFNILLLRISKTRDEYIELSNITKDEKSFRERITVITDKIGKSSLPDKVKCYYQKHLVDFGSIYLKLPHSWRISRDFDECKYDQNNVYFSKLQIYAKSGNIISTIGSIDDLMFLQSSEVSVVDTSNITAYSVLNLRGGENFNPRVITTVLNLGITIYFSYIHKELTELENSEFDELLTKLQRLGCGSAVWMRTNLRGSFGDCLRNPLNVSDGAIRSPETLSFMRKYVKYREQSNDCDPDWEWGLVK